jgi:hypothetical protein
MKKAATLRRVGVAGLLISILCLWVLLVWTPDAGPDAPDHQPARFDSDLVQIEEPAPIRLGGQSVDRGSIGVSDRYSVEVVRDRTFEGVPSARIYVVPAMQGEIDIGGDAIAVTGAGGVATFVAPPGLTGALPIIVLHPDFSPAHAELDAPGAHRIVLKRGKRIEVHVKSSQGLDVPDAVALVYAGGFRVPPSAGAFEREAAARRSGMLLDETTFYRWVQCDERGRAQMVTPNVQLYGRVTMDGYFMTGPSHSAPLSDDGVQMPTDQMEIVLEPLRGALVASQGLRVLGGTVGQSMGRGWMIAASIWGVTARAAAFRQLGSRHPDDLVFVEALLPQTGVVTSNPRLSTSLLIDGVGWVTGTYELKPLSEMVMTQIALPGTSHPVRLGTLKLPIISGFPTDAHAKPIHVTTRSPDGRAFGFDMTYGASVQVPPGAYEVLQNRVRSSGQRVLGSLVVESGSVTEAVVPTEKVLWPCELRIANAGGLVPGRCHIRVRDADAIHAGKQDWLEFKPLDAGSNTFRLPLGPCEIQITVAGRTVTKSETIHARLNLVEMTSPW